MKIVFEGKTKEHKNGNSKKRKSKRETSKVALGAVLTLYFIFVIFGMVYVWFKELGFEALCALVGGPTATGIGFYAWKAKNENIKKIGKNYVDDDSGEISAVATGVENTEARG